MGADPPTIRPPDFVRAETGRMRQRVTIQAPVTALDSGTAILSWKTIATVWAEVRALGGREAYYASEQHADSTVRVRIRFCESLGITARHRLLWGTRILYLAEAPRDVDGRRVLYEFLCREPEVE